MSTIAQYLFESSLSARTCSYTGDERASFSEDSNARQNKRGENASIATDTSRSAYGDMLEGMVVGMMESPDHRLSFLDDGDAEENSSFGGQTILSSAASAEYLTHQPSMQQETQALFLPQDAGFPPANLSPLNHPLSISTAQSCFLDLDNANEREIGTENMEVESGAPLSVQSSLLDSSMTFSELSQITQITRESNARNRYPSNSANSNNITNREVPHFTTDLVRRILPRSLSAYDAMALWRRSGVDSSRQAWIEWFSHFTDEDWAEFRERAAMLLRSVASSPLSVLRNHHLPPLPPILIDRDRLLEPAVEAVQVLQSCFICPLCQNAIVGALALDCSCGITVCSACWEYRCYAASRSGDDSTFDLAREWGYAIVPTQGTNIASFHGRSSVQDKCPHCLQNATNPVACPALDVAILQVVQNLPEKFCSFQRSYYQRLWYWREEITRRQQEDEDCEDDYMYRDVCIAQLIIEEEDILWRKQHALARRQRICSLSGTLGLLVAMVTSIGIKVIAQNQRSINRS